MVIIPEEGVHLITGIDELGNEIKQRITIVD
jgi:hypothetical protein